MKKHSFKELSLEEVKSFIETHENVAFGFLNEEKTKVEPAGQTMPNGTKVKLRKKEMDFLHYTLKPKVVNIQIVDYDTPCIMEVRKDELFIGCVGSGDADDFENFVLA